MNGELVRISLCGDVMLGRGIDHILPEPGDPALRALRAARQPFAGAGEDIAGARRPAAVPLPGGGRLLVFALGMPSSGIPDDWAAGEGRSGVHLVSESGPRRVKGAAEAAAEEI